MKTIKNLFKNDKERFCPPKSTQDVIPIQTMYKDGIFKIGNNKYSICYKFTDVNYAVASREDKETMFLQYSELLNSLDSGCTSKVTILNRKLNRLDLESNTIIPLNNDNLDEFRKEYNKIILDKAEGSNSIIQEKFLTVSVNKNSIEEARTFFTRMTSDLSNHFHSLGSQCKVLNATQRVKLFHDFYRIGEENIFTWDMIEDMKKGHSFKDYMCPDYFKFENDYFEMGNKVGRVFFLKDYANYIKDDMIAELKESKIRGFDKGRFSFNVKGGRCEACWGDGVKKIEMHFLPDVYVPCDVCDGKRYNKETLEVKFKGKNIYEVLEMRVSEAIDFFDSVPKIKTKLQMLIDVGLSYIKLGQSAPTLSGGEAGRIKLAKELQKKPTGKSIFILDEPTTGLHSEDIRKLLTILNRIVDNGDTVLVIEHNLDVIKVADHIIDLGPEGGDGGGEIVAVGTPEQIVKVSESYTGKYLKKML